MDPKEPRSRSPSLLDAGAHEASSAAPQGRILSGLQGDAPPPSVTNRPRRWLWPSVLLLVGCAAVLLLVLGGAFDGTDWVSATRVATQGRAESATSREPASIASGEMVPGMATPAAGQGGDTVADTSPNAAVILPGQSDSADSATTAAPAPAASASKDAVALSEIFTPASERKHAAPSRRVVRHARATTGDSDVALLTALIQHVEVGSPASRKVLEHIRHMQKPADTLDGIEARMQACPAANTEAGLRCRQKLCAGHSGQTAACPASSSDGA